MSEAAYLVSRALDAEREGRYLEAFELAHAALAEAPSDADAYNVIGRLCHLGGDLVSAIGLQQLALRAAPQHPRAMDDLNAALAAIPDRERGRRALAEALARVPDLGLHHLAPGALAPRADFDAVRALLEQAIAADPSLAQAHAALGNLLARHGLNDAAMIAYRRGLLLEPDDAAMHLALAEIAHEAGDEQTSSRHRAEALLRRRVYGAPDMSGAARAAHTSVLVLAAPGPWSANVALEFMLDPEQFDLQRMYLAADPPSAWEIPPHDLVFNAIGEAQAAQPAIAAAGAFLATADRPALNLPQHLAKTARPTLAMTLAGIAGLATPACARVERARVEPSADSIGGIAYPLLIRPLDTHGGRELARIADAHDLATYLESVPAAHYDVSAFVDYRSDDGFYRKYRVIFVNATPYPYHLAIAPEWMVHYRTSPMAAHAWMQAEEASFLSAPESVFPRWDHVFPAIAAAIGLDYFGIDCTRLSDGSVLVFEADAATWIHNRDIADPFAYKSAHVRRIFDAVATMIVQRARSRA